MNFLLEAVPLSGESCKPGCPLALYQDRASLATVLAGKFHLQVNNMECLLLQYHRSALAQVDSMHSHPWQKLALNSLAHRSRCLSRTDRCQQRFILGITHRQDDSAEKVLVIMEPTSTIVWCLYSDMLSVYVTNYMRKIPNFFKIFYDCFPLFRCFRNGEILSYKDCMYCHAWLADNSTDRFFPIRNR